MNDLISVIFLLTIVGVAQAQAPSGPRLSAADCRRIILHVPDPSVSYRPGVDVRGRPVVPADLPSSTAPLGPIAIVLSLDLTRRLGLPAELSGDLPLGTVVIDGDQVIFNGRPLVPQESSALAEACRRPRR